MVIVKPFELVGGHPALDLVNTLDFRFRESGPDELLASYGELLRFCVESKLLRPTQTRRLRHAIEGPRVLERVKELRESVSDVVYAGLGDRKIPSGAISLLDRCFHEAALPRKLRTKGSRLVWEWDRIGSDPSAPLWLLAHTAEELVLSDNAARIRACGSDTCRWLFLDTSKNRTRRWCDMKVCGNRMKARRFQSRGRGS